MTVQDDGPGGSADLPDAGLSLVEVIVAMVLLALVALAMIPPLVTGARVAANNREMSKAAQYVASELTKARQMDCVAVRAAVVGSDVNGFVLTPSATGPDGKPRAFSYYTLKDTIVDTPGGPCTPGQVYRLTATATSDDTSLKPVSATTLIMVP